MLSTSTSLLQQLREPGNQQAWNRFVQLYAPLLFYWCRQVGMQEADAADLVQDVLGLLVGTLPEFAYKRNGSFRGWLRTILLNRWRDQQRRLASRPGRDEAVPMAELPQPDADSDLLSHQEYRRYLLHQALDLVKPEFKQSTWRAFEEHGTKARPAAEVAGELGLSVGAVYAAKFRVMSRLREELEGLLD